MESISDFTIISSSRKLCHIEKISEIKPVIFLNKKGVESIASTIEVALILGWKILIKKNQFKAGDLCIYCEIDSILPDKPEFASLKDKGFRIKTLNIKDEIYQGVIFPISILDNYQKPEEFKIEEGVDVTNILGVIKYDPDDLAVTGKGNFPAFLRKTDEERIQNIDKILVIHRDIEFYVTEKIDGTSASYYYKDGSFGVCSRNLELGKGENHYWCIANQFNIEEKLRKYGKNLCIQGEIIGERIQKNLYGIKGKMINFFSAFDIDKRVYLEYKDFEDTMKKLDLEIVPILDSNFKLPGTIDEIVKYAEGKSALNEKSIREGVVIRNKKHIPYRISFKVISNQYLLRYE